MERAQNEQPYEKGTPEGELMDRIVQGDTSAIGVLYVRYGKDVMRVLCRAYGGKAHVSDLEDLCHDTFVRLVEIAHYYREEGKFLPWLLQVAVREARKQQRKTSLRSKLFRLFIAEKHAEDGLTSMTTTHESVKKKMENALEQLSLEQREVFILAVGEGMSGEEVAQILSISHTAVRSRLMRARSNLKKILKDSTWGD